MANIQQEVWKPIENFEGIYEVSNLGRIKSLPRIDCMGQKRKEKILSQGNDKNGYKILPLSKDRIRVPRKAHRLVAQAFIPNPNNLPQVNHKNGIKHDNRVENLEWCDNSQNIKHAISLGLINSKGEANNSCILTESQVVEIYNSKGKNKEIALRFNIGVLAVCRIRNGRNWSHVTGHIYKQRYSPILEKETVVSIFNSEKNPRELSKEIGIPEGTIGMIKRGQSYSNITGKVYERKYKKI